MKNFYRKLVAYSLMLIIVQGCTTLADARKAEGEGQKKIYSTSVDATWDATVKALEKLKLEIATQNKSEGYILAQRGMSLFSAGENVAIFIKKKGVTESEVEVVSKKAMKTNIFAPDWTDDIYKEISIALNR